VLGSGTRNRVGCDDAIATYQFYCSNWKKSTGLKHTLLSSLLFIRLGGQLIQSEILILNGRATFTFNSYHRQIKIALGSSMQVVFVS